MDRSSRLRTGTVDDETACGQEATFLVTFEILAFRALTPEQIHYERIFIMDRV